MTSLLCQPVKIDALSLQKFDINGLPINGKKEELTMHKKECCSCVKVKDKDNTTASGGTKHDRCCGWDKKFADMPLHKLATVNDKTL